MAVQATNTQSDAFADLAQQTQAAADQLHAVRELAQSHKPPAGLFEQVTTLDGTIKKIHDAGQSFLASFSAAQKSGLKEASRKLVEADAELEKQIKLLDTFAPQAKTDGARFLASLETLDKSLAGLQNAQSALAGEMSIILPGQELAYDLPAVARSGTIAGQPVSIPASAILSRTSSVGHNLFDLQIVADLSDLQQNLTAILRAKFARVPLCGERVQIQEATLAPAAPAGVAVIHSYVEHWICPSQSPTELASGEGTIEIKLIPWIDQDAHLQLRSEIGQIHAEGFLRDLLAGSLGNALRDETVTAVLSAMQEGANLKAILPPPAQDLAAIAKAQFEDGAGRLGLVVEGHLQLSDDQTKELVAQLRQALSAQKSAP
jgi:hypothetical protein